MSSKQIYLAAPCFSAAERSWNVAVKNELEFFLSGLDFELFLPQEHVEESWDAATIQGVLVKGLVSSSILIANLDGPGGDDGTCWEMGFVAGMNQMALGLGRLRMGRSIYWYRTDFRRGGDSDLNVNLMMAYCGNQITLSGTKPFDVAKAIGETLT